MWQEKNLNVTAKNWLSEHVLETEFQLNYPGEKDTFAYLTFFDCSVEGEVSLHRNDTGCGKPRPIFDLKLDIEWKCEIAVDDGKSFIDTKGEFRVFEFSSEDLDDPSDIQVKLICDDVLPDGAGPSAKQVTSKLKDAVRIQGIPKMQKMLNKDFVEFLNKIGIGSVNEKEKGG